MAKSTPHFNDMMAARGGMGQPGNAPTAGRKLPPPPKAPGKTGGKMPKPPMAPDTDWDGK